MAFTATAILEIQSGSTANNANAGFFDPGLTASMATDLVTTNGTSATPTVTSASDTFATARVSDWLYVASGTGWNSGAWYKITAISGGVMTLNAATGAAIVSDSTLGYPTPKFRVSTVQGIATSNSPAGNATWSVDQSQQTTGIVQAAADLTIDLTDNTKVTSATRVAKPNDVGNCMHITTLATGTVGWYFVKSVAGGAFFLDRSPGAVGLVGTYSLGGAASLNSSTANQTDTNLFGAMVSGNRYFLKGALTIATSPNPSNATNLLPIRGEGYQTTRGDAPTGANRPTINCGTQAFTLKISWELLHVSLTGTGTTVLSVNSFVYLFNCKITDTGSTANQNAISRTGGTAITTISNCEVVCYRGRAINAGDSINTVVRDCYIHDSDIGFTSTGTTQIQDIANNIFENCVTAAIRSKGSNANGIAFCSRNTIYGAENKLGIGIDILTGGGFNLLNNTIYGCVSGVVHADATGANNQGTQSDYNDYFNNTTDNTNWYKGPNDQALNPNFSSVSQITSSIGKFAASNDRLIETAKDFTALGVVAGVDCVYIKSGTGVSAGIYGISSIATTTNANDTLVLDLAPGTSTVADKVFQITVGHNFAIGANLRALGFPGAFQGGYTQAYTDIGACQRQERGHALIGVSGVI